MQLRQDMAMVDLSRGHRFGVRILLRTKNSDAKPSGGCWVENAHQSHGTSARGHSFASSAVAWFNEIKSM